MRVPLGSAPAPIPAGMLCQLQRSSSIPSCGAPDLLARSYPVRARWPFEAFHLIMEFAPGQCDFYSGHATVKPFCCHLTTRESIEPERHVTQAIASFLAHCLRRRCRSLDLGANNGWMSAFMMMSGSHVISVEPATDFARAIEETAALNCWKDRSVVLNARACAKVAGDGCMRPSNTSNCEGGGWRYGNNRGPSQNRANFGSSCSARFGLPATVEGQRFSQVVMQAAGEARVLDLVKMDADGPEGAWLAELDEMISARTVKARALIIEGSHLQPHIMQRYQMVHGYTILRLDEHDNRRRITEGGVDALSTPGSIAPLSRFAEEFAVHDRVGSKYSVRGTHLKPGGDNVSRLELEEELFGIRAMRHVFRVKPNMTLQGWVTVLNPVHVGDYPPQFAMTLEPYSQLLEPTFRSVGFKRSPAWQAHSNGLKPSAHASASEGTSTIGLGGAEHVGETTRE